MSVSAGASEEKSSAHWMGIERAEPDFNHKRRPVIEAGRQPTGWSPMRQFVFGPQLPTAE